MERNEERRLSTSDIAGVAEDEPVAGKPGERNGVNEEVETDDAAASERAAPLFAADETQGYRTRWDAIQTGFVDEPRRAVEEADALVADLMKRLAEGFAKERDSLEKQWDRGDQISTEDLRVALRRYRSFFQRLLSL